MTHEPEEQPLAPATEARVRRLLADARHSEPMPPDVAARMDRTLADLAAERADGTGSDAGTGGAEVVPLAPRARRLRAGALLAGAAAVVLVGIGVGRLVGTGGEGGGADTAADATVARGPEAELADEGGGKAEDQAQARAGTAEEASSQGAPAETLITEEPPPTIRPRRLQADLTALQHATMPHPARADYLGTTVTQPEDFPCAPASWGHGVVVAVLYESMPAMVAFREPTGDSQVAEVLQCGTGDVLRSTILPTSG